MIYILKHRAKRHNLRTFLTLPMLESYCKRNRIANYTYQIKVS